MAISSQLNVSTGLPTSMNCQNVSSPATDWQLGFQQSAAPVMEGITAFHDDLMVFLTLILGFVVYILGVCIVQYTDTTGRGTSARLVHAPLIEIVWTVVPALVLIVVAIPSFSLLYSLDEVVEPVMTVKVVGHQWYWSYEMLNTQLISKDVDAHSSDLTYSFDSYLLGDDEILAGSGLSRLRLLTVDNHLILPVGVPVRALITSSDVLHSWAIPALGIKLDACPGRLNQTALHVSFPGLYYGQCSEICGVNHGFMPIGIAALDVNEAYPYPEHLEALISTVQALVNE